MVVRGLHLYVLRPRLRSAPEVRAINDTLTPNLNSPWTHTKKCGTLARLPLLKVAPRATRRAALRRPQR